MSKSIYDHTPQFYVQHDIIDPTPYEGESPWRFDECDCPICGQGFRRDEGLLSLRHKEMKHEILIHESCVWDAALSAQNPEHAILNFLEDIGFEVEEIEPIERD